MNLEVHDNLAPIDTVFMHGNLAANLWWQPALKIWQSQPAGRGARLIMGEWRGCGKSPAPSDASELHPARLADDYIQALRGLGVKKASIVAHSTGGLIALFAMKQAPELFSRAVLLDPVGAQGVQFAPPMLEAFTRMSEDREFCALVMSGTIYQPRHLDPAYFASIVDAAFNVAPLNWHGVPRALAEIDIRADLGSITQPILILHGEHDAILPLADAQALAGGLANAQLKVLSGRGHSCNVEDPETFVALVNQFLF